MTHEQYFPLSNSTRDHVKYNIGLWRFSELLYQHELFNLGSKMEDMVHILRDCQMNFPHWNYILHPPSTAKQMVLVTYSMTYCGLSLWQVVNGSVLRLSFLLLKCIIAHSFYAKIYVLMYIFILPKQIHVLVFTIIFQLPSLNLIGWMNSWCSIIYVFHTTKGLISGCIYNEVSIHNVSIGTVIPFKMKMSFCFSSVFLMSLSNISIF